MGENVKDNFVKYNLWSNYIDFTFSPLGIVKWFFFLIIAILLLVPGLAFFVIWKVTDGFSGKCKYHKVCPKFSKESVTCMKDKGEYPVDMFSVMPAHCYKRMEEEIYEHHLK